jgi:hypothetical protein
MFYSLDFQWRADDFAARLVALTRSNLRATF